MKFHKIARLREGLTDEFRPCFAQTEGRLAESFGQEVAAIRWSWEAGAVEDASPTEDLKGGRVKNRRRLLDLVRQYGALSREDLALKTGLSRATVSSLVNELRKHGLVISEDFRSDSSRIGRPPSMVALRESVGAAVGINITGEAIQVAVGNVGLELLAEREVRPDQFPIPAEPQATLQLTATIVHELLAATGLAPSQVIGGAIGVTVPIDTRDGTVGVSSFLPSWDGWRPAALLEPRLGFPILLENDANLAALAEALAGAVEGASDVLYIKASSMIGCGLIINGRLRRGAYGGAGEIAHMIVQPGGQLCFCGRRGCLAQVVFGGTMVKEVQEGHRRRLAPAEFDPDALDVPGLDQQLDLVVQWARKGDPMSSRVLRDAGRDLGIAVANVCQILNPERVVVGGAMPGAGDVFMEPFNRAIRDHTTLLPGWPVPVVPSRWQDRAELVGAVALGIRAEKDEFAARLWELVESTLLDRPRRRRPLPTT
jgi:predicted NBD/HSP70 family sugar kinase